jgi:hypothetical protein
MGWGAVLLAAAVIAGPAAHAAQTNGTGGGRWASPPTWAQGRLPAAAEPVQVMPGDVLVVAGPDGVSCSGLIIEEGGRVQFDVSGGQLTCRGDIDVAGACAMGPGSTLLVDCPTNMRYGIFVGARGSLVCIGSHGFDRNCVISAAQRDGKHNTFIRIERDGKAVFRFCDISYLGGKPPTESRTQAGYGLFFWIVVTLEGCHVHHCAEGVHIITGGRITLKHNLFTDNARGLILYRPSGVTVTGNRFVGNGLAMSAAGKHTEASCAVFDNLFDKNKVGLEVRGLLATASFHGNTYVENEVGLRIASSNAPVAAECFASNRYAVELAPGTGGGRLSNASFGSFQGESRPSLAADVLVTAPGPSNLLLDGCRFSRPEPVEFAPAVAGAPDGPRWIASRNHDGGAGATKHYRAAAGRP